jgi:hypothetical protein
MTLSTEDLRLALEAEVDGLLASGTRNTFRTRNGHGVVHPACGKVTYVRSRHVADLHEKSREPLFWHLATCPAFAARLAAESEITT